jgi:hypothetical protein
VERAVCMQSLQSKRYPHPLPLTAPMHAPPRMHPQDAATFAVSFVTVVPFFKVTEKFPLSGSTQMGRRDLRAGRQTATARRIEGGVGIAMSWGEPLAGECGGGRGWSCFGLEGGQVGVTVG